MKIKSLLILILVLSVVSCNKRKESHLDQNKSSNTGIELIVLGTAQDAGAPQIACKKECCASRYDGSSETFEVVSLGVVNHDLKSSYLFEATPDIAKQSYYLNNVIGSFEQQVPNAVFLTHAHIGHYTGLMYYGKEALSANAVDVYAMPRFQNFLRTNGPWDQLVSNKNIVLQNMENGKSVELEQDLQVTPLLVPHRDEYSETVGYTIKGTHKTALFIPDIDKWSKWNTSIDSLVQQVDYAFLDATFYDAVEINNRDISQIPHPFVIESFEQFKNLSKTDKAKIHFIHFNHTNPLLDSTSDAYQKTIDLGFNIAQKGDRFKL